MMDPLISTSAATATLDMASFPPTYSPSRSPVLLVNRKATAAASERWQLFPDGIISLTVDIPNSQARPVSPVLGFDGAHPARENAGRSRARASNEPSASRWRTKEFSGYYAVVLAGTFGIVKVAVDLSRESHPNYLHFSHRLSPGWMFGWKVDTSDHQWSTFRDNIPILAVLVVVWIIASRLFFRQSFSVAPSHTSAVPHSSMSPSPPSSSRRVTFILGFAIPLLVAFHGTSLLKMFILLSINFAVSRLASIQNGRWARVAPSATWVVNIGMMFANEVFDGYRWASISSHLAWMDAPSLAGVMPRWHISWNITMLRLVSFNLDYYWACTSVPPSPLLNDEVKESVLLITDRARIVTSHPLSTYTFSNYIAYALYPPLYIAGPIITFNSFFSQLVLPTSISRRTIVSYAIRYIICLFTMELVLHNMYVVAIKDSSAEGSWRGDSAYELGVIGFWNLIVVWLKLLIPWRFFRLWALLDGIDPPENMVRCMADNYSTLGFWRAWHRSYNLWIVRYLYIPLGGAKHAALATLAVFTFVAMWHDLSLKLLSWGWMISFFVFPEMIANKLIPSAKYGRAWWYRHLAAMGGVFNVFSMMSANLVGFAIGTEGITYMWSQIVGTFAGMRFIVVASFVMFAQVQIMFEYREEELRRGIARRC